MDSVIGVVCGRVFLGSSHGYVVVLKRCSGHALGDLFVGAFVVFDTSGW